MQIIMRAWSNMILYAIVCYVQTKDGLTQVIINIEAQKDEPGTYDIINRAIFYESRLISSQKERDFKGTEYNNIKKYILSGYV